MEEFNDLIQKFKVIAKKGAVKSISTNFGSIGTTFENELGKKADSMIFPDYHGIELKCTSDHSKYPLYLFSVAFDGPTYPEINRIIEKYGWYDKDYTDKKVFFANLSCAKKTTVNSYRFKLELDDKNEKLHLNVYDFKNNLIDNLSFVYISSIYSHFIIKLNKLALVIAKVKEIKGEKYFKYYKMILYKSFDFDNFINLMKRGIIKISLIARINKSGKDSGRYRNKNLVFQIKKDYLDKLFYRIDIIE